MNETSLCYKGKNVLVAGGGGLIGQNLIMQLLAAGAHVRATQHQSRRISVQHKNLEIVTCDLLRGAEAQEIFQDMDLVFIAAARIRGAKGIKEDPSGIILYNLDLHSKLIHLAAKMKAERCAFVSSSYVYPHTGRPNVEAEGFEGDPWIPMNYGIGWCNRYLETLCRHFHMTSRTKYAIIRPTAIYGPFDNFNLDECHVIPALIVKAVNRMNPYEIWGNGEDVRCFTYAEDVAEGLLLTMKKYAEAKPLNICCKDAHRVKDVISTILGILGFSPEIRFNSSKPSLIPYKVSDPGMAKTILGWKARTSLEEGLKKTIQWYSKEY
ncbi:MAG: hypothetical protein A2036_01085 [Omnitrophica bacterium GWA2_50_21]|nr:MAG: hypothetical protein A2036_01085 [Omnitrophica bacterium GWA2_50_21]